MTIEKEGFKLKRISDRLFLLKVPKNNNGNFSDEAGMTQRFNAY
jgi:hypothetical protein